MKFLEHLLRSWFGDSHIHCSYCVQKLLKNKKIVYTGTDIVKDAREQLGIDITGL